MDSTSPPTAPSPLDIRTEWLATAVAYERLGGLLAPSPTRRAVTGPLAQRALAAVAREDGQAVGAVLAHVHPSGHVGEVLGLGVVPDARRRGVGRALLRAIEPDLVQRAEAVQASWRSDWAGADAIGATLQSAGWEPPREQKLLYKIGPWVCALDWVQSQPPAGYTVTDWAALTDDDVAEVRRLAASADAREVPPHLDDSDPAISVWLRHQGRIVGWMRTVRRSPSLIEYSALYVAPEHRQPGAAVAPLAESVRRQCAEHRAGGVLSQGVFAVAQENEPMRAFAGHLYGDRVPAATVWIGGKRLRP